MGESHFFGSTAFNWATGSTRQEVIDKLAKQAGSDVIARQVKASGGLYVWTCKVFTPADATYGIANFQPEGVPIGHVEQYNIVSVKGAVKLFEA